MAIGIPMLYFKAWRGPQTSFQDRVEEDEDVLS